LNKDFWGKVNRQGDNECWEWVQARKLSMATGELMLVEGMRQVTHIAWERLMEPASGRTCNASHL